jgi:hypothetical protein
MRVFLIFLAAFGLCDAFQEPPNAQHLFNAIHSSMRQWGSSLNHNGMSFFLATVPKGTQLYHGTGRNCTFTGLEWLALEPEHAMNFAWIVDSPHRNDTDLCKDMSMKWWSAPPMAEPHDNFSPERMVMAAPPTHPPDKPLPRLRLRPGWLHSYAAKRDLRFLYVDGMSAAKSPKGTLDSQDYILRAAKPPPQQPFNDLPRASDMCELARKQWQGVIDGFIRMEHGFEIILCDFANLDLVRMTRNKDRNGDAESPVSSTPDEDLLSFFRAVVARYNGVGGERVRMYYDDFVSAFAYDDLDLLEGGSELPRLHNISSVAAKRILNDITNLVLHPGQKPGASSVNWQLIADEIVERYGKRLKYFVSGAFPTKKLLDDELDRLLRPFIDYDHRSVSEETERCALDFMPDPFNGATAKSLTARSVYAISHKICSTLRNAMEDKNHGNSIDRIIQLIEYLEWTTWKYCDPGCSLDMVCFIAIWPYGTVEDHYHPSCKNGTGMFNRSNYYWRFDNSHLYGQKFPEPSLP